MYYVQVVETLEEKKGERLSASDIFYILNSQRSVNSLNLKKALLKAYLNHPRVEREWQYVKTVDGKTWREYVYFFSD